MQPRASPVVPDVPLFSGPLMGSQDAARRLQTQQRPFNDWEPKNLSTRERGAATTPLHPAISNQISPVVSAQRNYDLANINYVHTRSPWY